MSIAKKSEIISANNVTITENERKIYKAGQLKLLQDSEYMNANISGTAIAVNDVSPIEHSVGCKVVRKNLCSNKYTDYADTSYKSLYVANAPLIMSFKDKDTSVDVSGCYFGFCVNPDNVSAGGYRWILENGIIKFVKTNNATSNAKLLCPYLMFYPESEETFNKIMQRWDIQVEKGTTATEYTPYVSDLTSIGVSRYGKNLLNPQFDIGTAQVSYIDGVLFTPSYGGNTVVANTKSLYIPQNTWLYYKHTLLLGKDRIIIKCYNANGENIGSENKREIECTTAWYLATYGGYVIDNPSNGFSFKITSDVAYIKIAYCGMNSEGGNKYADLKLEIGTTATPYEPYIEPTVHTANADGTVEGVTSISPNMTLLTNNNGVVINANYLRDIDTYIDNLITDVALSGGEA